MFARRLSPPLPERKFPHFASRRARRGAVKSPLWEEVAAMAGEVEATRLIRDHLVRIGFEPPPVPVVKGAPGFRGYQPVGRDGTRGPGRHR